jgi:NAD(P)-dependent dehydrogenase (short-subunit alcohol dehydrogenase family)
MVETRTVLTTGANSGIGLATAIRAAQHGFRSVGSVRSTEKAQEVREAANDAGVVVETVLLDVTDADRCEQVIDEVRPWGIVNNAGFPVTGAIEDVAEDEVRLALETMTLGPMRLARLALPHMREHGEGRIVNVSSIFGRATGPLTGWYQAAKHALEAASDALRAEVASAGIVVVLVQPGGIRTALWEDVRETVGAHTGSRYRRAYERTLAQIRLLDPLMRSPEHVADVIMTAITTSAPRSRYLVGLDARTAALADQVLPTGVKDRLTRLTLGL